MRRFFQILAAVVALSAIILWVSGGARWGWTRTSREVKTLDPVTGIDGITYEKKFQPGVEFPAAGLFAAGILTGVSFLFRTKSKTTKDLTDH